MRRRGTQIEPSHVLRFPPSAGTQQRHAVPLVDLNRSVGDDNDLGEKTITQLIHHPTRTLPPSPLLMRNRGVCSLCALGVLQNGHI